MTADELKELKQITRLRILLECYAIDEIVCNTDRQKKATERLTPYIDEFQNILRLGDYRMFDKTDQSLHRTLVELADVPILMDQWERIWTVYIRSYRYRVKKYWSSLRMLTSEHQYLTKTICCGDAVAAQEAIRTHLESLWFRMAEVHGGLQKDEQDPVQRVSAYLSCHLHQPISLQQVARQVAFTSPGHLSHLFRERYGMGFQKHLITMRLEKGAELLRSTQLSVKQIAARSGYTSISRFCEHFKRRYHTTPAAYRKSIRTRHDVFPRVAGF